MGEKIHPVQSDFRTTGVTEGRFSVTNRDLAFLADLEGLIGITTSTLTIQEAIRNVNIEVPVASPNFSIAGPG